LKESWVMEDESPTSARSKDAPMGIQPDYSDSQISSPDSFCAHPDYPMDAVSAINLQFFNHRTLCQPGGRAKKDRLGRASPPATRSSL
jgi:hypothetical protein